MDASPEWSVRTRRQEERLPMRGVACVIEPDGFSRDQIASSLRAMGFTVHETGCGRVGEFIAAQVRLNILVLDLALPDVKGLMLLRKLRRANSALGLIALTREPLSAIPMTLARFAGADAVLASPPSNEALCLAVVETERFEKAAVSPLPASAAQH